MTIEFLWLMLAILLVGASCYLAGDYHGSQSPVFAQPAAQNPVEQTSTVVALVKPYAEVELKMVEDITNNIQVILISNDETPTTNEETHRLPELEQFTGPIKIVEAPTTTQLKEHITYLEQLLKEKERLRRKWHTCYARNTNTLKQLIQQPTIQLPPTWRHYQERIAA